MALSVEGGKSQHRYPSGCSTFDYENIRDLMRKGHRVRFSLGIYADYQAIMRKNGVYYGASESRKDGQAAGY